MKKLLHGLITRDGEISHTKFWEAICYTVVTFIMIKLTYMSQLTENYLIIYIGTLAVRGGFSKYISTKSPPKKGNDE